MIRDSSGLDVGKEELSRQTRSECLKRLAIVSEKMNGSDFPNPLIVMSVCLFFDDDNLAHFHHGAWREIRQHILNHRNKDKKRPLKSVSKLKRFIASPSENCLINAFSSLPPSAAFDFLTTAGQLRSACKTKDKSSLSTTAFELRELRFKLERAASYRLANLHTLTFLAAVLPQAKWCDLDVSRGKCPLLTPAVNFYSECGVARFDWLDCANYENVLEGDSCVSLFESCSCPSGLCLPPCHEGSEECNASCPCGLSCPNRLVQLGRVLPLLLFYHPQKEWCCMTLVEIPEGTFVSEYTGKVIRRTDAINPKKVDQPDWTTYLFDIDAHEVSTRRNKKRVSSMQAEGFTIDAFDCGNESRFFSHSHQPNLAVRAISVRHPDARLASLALYSRRRIRAYEELTYDYCIPVQGKGTVVCKCGAPQCLGGNSFVF